MDDRERTLDSPTGKIMMSLAAFADELEREKARQRTYDAMQRKAKAGHNCGGRTFGYDNLDVLGPSGDRAFVTYRVNDAEAVVVRRIFALAAMGEGLKSITKQLNAEGATAPRPQQGRTRAWAPSSVRDILHREMYRGRREWNKTRKRDANVTMRMRHPLLHTPKQRVLKEVPETTRPVALDYLHYNFCRVHQTCA